MTSKGLGGLRCDTQIMHHVLLWKQLPATAGKTSCAAVFGNKMFGPDADLLEFSARYSP